MVIKVMSGVTYRIQHGVKGKPKIVHFDRLKDFFGPLPKKWVAWKSRVMGSTEMEGAEGGEDSDQMPLGTGETMLATLRVESEVHTAGVGSEETGSAEGFLVESAGRSGRSRVMPLRLRETRWRFEVRPWQEWSVWGLEWSGDGPKLMPAIWMLFRVALGSEGRIFKPPTAQRGP